MFGKHCLQSEQGWQACYQIEQISSHEDAEQDGHDWVLDDEDGGGDCVLDDEDVGDDCVLDDEDDCDDCVRYDEDGDLFWCRYSWSTPI